MTALTLACALWGSGSVWAAGEFRAQSGTAAVTFDVVASSAPSFPSTQGERPLRLRSAGSTGGVSLVEPDSPGASPFRIRTPSSRIKAFGKEWDAAGAFACPNISANYRDAGTSGGFRLRVSDNIILDPQTGTFHQVVAATNLTGGEVSGVKLTVGGFQGGDCIYTGGANQASSGCGPHAIDGRPLGAGRTSCLMIRYYVASRNPSRLAGLTFSAQASGAGPAPSGGSLSVPILSMLAISGPFSSSRNLIGWRMEPGKVYAIDYSDDAGVTWHRGVSGMVRTDIAVPSGAQWVDPGPPDTRAHPATVPGRSYRIFRTP